MRMLHITIFAAIAVLLYPTTARLQDAGIAAEVCAESGVCAPMDPATALIVIGIAQIAKELSKDDPFGENNEIVKAAKNMINDLKNGPGPNNDLVKIFNNIGNDIRCGPGPNNDIIKFLQSVGIKISVTGCS